MFGTHQNCYSFGVSKSVEVTGPAPMNQLSRGLKIWQVHTAQPFTAAFKAESSFTDRRTARDKCSHFTLSKHFHVIINILR